MNRPAEEALSHPVSMASRGLYYGWYIVATTIVGVALGYSVVAVMTFGTFINPLEKAFGWTRGQISLGLSIISYTALFVVPLSGMLVDRIGAKRVLIPSTLLFAMIMASMYYLTPSLWHFYAMCLTIPILGAGTAPLTYSRLIVGWFDRKRGLALGIGLVGVGLGTSLVPIFATWIMEQYSWREAYLGIGILIVVLVVPVASIVLRDSPQELGLLPDGDKPDEQETARATRESLIGFTGREALRQRSFWLMVGSFALAGLATSTILIHLIPLMVDRGMTRAEAAGTFAFLGIALMIGRLLAGYLMDKLFAPRVVVAFLLAPAIGLALFAYGVTGTPAAICAALVGLAIGAEFDVMAYFTSRYFGPRSFGQIYGYNYSAFKAGSATGPLIMGVAYDVLGRYDEILWAMSGIMLCACVLVAKLPQYPQLPARPKV